MTRPSNVERIQFNSEAACDAVRASGAIVLFSSIAYPVEKVLAPMRQELPDLQVLRSSQIQQDDLRTWTAEYRVIFGGAAVELTSRVILQQLRNLVVYGGLAGNLDEAAQLFCHLAQNSIVLDWDWDVHRFIAKITPTETLLNRARLLNDWQMSFEEYRSCGSARGMLVPMDLPLPW
jgi:hypothetical protein